MPEERTLRTLRSMAWERAKGELKSMLTTYYDDNGGDKYIPMRDLISKFIEEVEREGLQE